MTKNTAESADIGRLRSVGRELSILALSRALVWARVFASLFLLCLAIYAMSRREPSSIPLYMILFVNLVPYLAAFCVSALSKKVYNFPFPQLAKDFRFSRASFLGNLIGAVCFIVLTVFLKSIIFTVLLAGFVVVLAGSFAICRITIRRKLEV